MIAGFSLFALVIAAFVLLTILTAFLSSGAVGRTWAFLDRSLKTSSQLPVRLRTHVPASFTSQPTVGQAPDGASPAGPSVAGVASLGAVASFTGPVPVSTGTVNAPSGVP